MYDSTTVEVVPFDRTPWSVSPEHQFGATLPDPSPLDRSTPVPSHPSHLPIPPPPSTTSTSTPPPLHYFLLPTHPLAPLYQSSSFLSFSTPLHSVQYAPPLKGSGCSTTSSTSQRYQAPCNLSERISSLSSVANLRSPRIDQTQAGVHLDLPS